MQIHEITGGRRNGQLDEGLWDTIKGAAQAAAGSKWLNTRAWEQSKQVGRLAQQSKQYVDMLVRDWNKESPDLLRRAYGAPGMKKSSTPGTAATPGPGAAQSYDNLNVPAYQRRGKNPQVNEDAEDDQVYSTVLKKWLDEKMQTNVDGVRLTMNDVREYDPRVNKELENLLNTAATQKSDSAVSAYISRALSAMQHLSQVESAEQKDAKKKSAEKRLVSRSDAVNARERGETHKQRSGIAKGIAGSEEEALQAGADRTFTVTDDNGDETEVFVKNDEYLTRADNGKLVPVEDEDEVETIEYQDPENQSEQDVQDNMPPEDSELSQVVPEEDLRKAAKKVTSDSSESPNVPDANFRVIDWTPNLVIRVGGKEFMMNDDNYPERQWFTYPAGAPVKPAMIPSLDKMADQAFKYQDDAASGGEPESDIDVGASENAGVRVEPGTKLRLRDPRNNGVYYKDALGNWSTEDGRRLKKPETIKYLENKVKTNGESRVEKVLPPTPEEKRKGVGA